MPVHEHSLVYVSRLCDDGHTVEFKTNQCDVKRKDWAVGVCESAGGIYSVNLQRLVYKAMVTRDATGDILSVLNARIAHPDRGTINKVAKSGAVHGMEMAEGPSTNNCSTFVDGTMTNRPMCSPSIFEGRSSAVCHTDVVEMNVPSVGEDSYFVTFIDVASGYVSASHLETEGEAAEFLKRTVRRFKRQTGCVVKNILLDRGKEICQKRKGAEI